MAYKGLIILEIDVDLPWLSGSDTFEKSQTEAMLLRKKMLAGMKRLLSYELSQLVTLPY